MNLSDLVTGSTLNHIAEQVENKFGISILITYSEAQLNPKEAVIAIFSEAF